LRARPMRDTATDGTKKASKIAPNGIPPDA
jgi:hypothetical protein